MAKAAEKNPARMKAHPAAEIFPLLAERELVALQEKFVAARTQLVPIVTHEGKILDGRNREEVCHRLGWTPRTITWHEWLKQNGVALVPPPSPTEWVISINLDRRHLNEGQRALAAAKALPLLEAEAARRREEGGARGRAARSGPRGPEPKTTSRAGKQDASQTSRANREAIAGAGAKKPKRARDEAAKLTGASPRQVQRAKELIEKRPDLAALVDAAKMTLGKAEKTIRKEEALKNVLEYRPPVGKYAVIVADPSWKFDDALDGSDQARGGVGYPSQTEEEICAMQVGKNQAAPDCALWLFVTNTHLINGAASRVLAAWGFDPKALMTWRKVDSKGKDRLGAGHYMRNVTEHAILAVRGKPVVNGADVPNIFDAPRTSRHSEKPARFFEIAEKVTPCAPEARLELFAIEERKGWVTSGSEQQAAARKAQAGEIAWRSTKDGLGFNGKGTSGRSYVVYRSDKKSTAWFAADESSRGGRKGPFVDLGRAQAWCLSQEPSTPPPPIDPGPPEEAQLVEPELGAADMLVWRETTNGQLTAKGEGGRSYRIAPHSQGLELVTVTEYWADAGVGSTADVVNRPIAKMRAEEWEKRARSADAASKPKKARKLTFVDVPGDDAA